MLSESVVLGFVKNIRFAVMGVYMLDPSLAGLKMEILREFWGRLGVDDVCCVFIRPLEYPGPYGYVYNNANWFRPMGVFVVAALHTPRRTAAKRFLESDGDHAVMSRVRGFLMDWDVNPPFESPGAAPFLGVPSLRSPPRVFERGVAVVRHHNR